MPLNPVVQDPGVEISMPGATDYIPNLTSGRVEPYTIFTRNSADLSSQTPLFNLVHCFFLLSSRTTRKTPNDTEAEPHGVSVGHVAERCRRRQGERNMKLQDIDLPSCKLTWQKTFVIGDTSLNACFSIVMLVFGGVSTAFSSKVWLELTWKCTLDMLKVDGGNPPFSHPPVISINRLESIQEL